MNEVTWFRLLLFVLALLLIPGWGVSAMNYYDAMAADAEYRQSQEFLRQRQADCDSGARNDCEQDEWRPSAPMPGFSYSEGPHYREIAWPWFLWSTAPAACLIILFYGLRWAFTGRVRPFWVLSGAPRAKEAP